MKKQLFTTALILASLFPNNSSAREIDPDLFSLCSKFPQNSKCKGWEIPIPLKERKGTSASCKFAVGDYQKNAKCKIDFVDNSLVIYQERGKEIEQLGDRKLTVEKIIDSDRIIIHNSQIWNKIYRWEINYLLESETENKNITNSLVILGNSELSETISGNIAKISLNKSQEKFSQAKIINTNNNSSKIAQLLETKECVGCDLSNANLANADLKDANLEGSNLQGVNLTGANIKNAYLVGTNLSEANLTEADLGGANLTLAKLNNTILLNADLQAVNFQGADLQKANLTDAYLRAPTFLKEANLTEANLTRTDLRGANFYKANLTRANLTEANLKDTNVKLKNIPGNYSIEEKLLDQLIGFPIFGLSNSGVDFKTNLEKADLEEANFQGATFEEVSITDANLTNANLTNSKMEKTNLERANLCNTTMPDEIINNRDC